MDNIFERPCKIIWYKLRVELRNCDCHLRYVAFSDRILARECFVNVLLFVRVDKNFVEILAENRQKRANPLKQ